MVVHALPLTKLLAQLETSERGLTTRQVRQRLDKYGPNVLPRQPRTSAIRLLLRQFVNPFAYILAAALIISVISGSYLDAAIISAVIVVSIFFSFVQEYRATRVFEQLAKFVRTSVRVLRDERQHILSPKELVPGDIVHLTPGDEVPADARIMRGSNLTAIEAPLTGESVPSQKHAGQVAPKTALADRENMLYMGTVLASGSATVVVTATGRDTELGHIARIVKAAQKIETPLQQQLKRFARVLGIVMIAINGGIFALGVLTGRPLYEMFLTSVAVVVSAVPEGLLPALTVILAVGMQKLAKQRALVRRMVAAETLGAVTVIAADKTGTLTQGEMRVAELLIPVAAHANGALSSEQQVQQQRNILTAAVFANDATIESNATGKSKLIGDPTDTAILRRALDLGIDRNDLLKKEPEHDVIPFDTSYKFSASLHGTDQRTLYVKGAPETIMERASHLMLNNKTTPLSQDLKETFINQYEHATATGLRVLAVATRTWDQTNQDLHIKDVRSLTIQGLIGLRDPLRADAVSSIALARKAGIRPLLVTGDHKLTALTIAQQLHFDISEDQIVTGAQLDEMTDVALERSVQTMDVYARVSPRHKIRIVRALQASDEVVAMAGDGVNDAPALKQADVGIAVGSGTDVAKEVADIVLLDDSFTSMVEAVRRGRIVYGNVRKMVLYVLTDAFTEIVLVGGTVLLGLPLPLLPAQILWINLLEDAAPASTLGFDDLDEGVMKQPPRRRGEPLLGKPYRWLIFWYVLIMDATAFGIFLFVLNQSDDLAYARTVLFAGLTISSLVYIYAARGLHTSVLTNRPLSNRPLNAVVLLGLALLILAIYLPPLQILLQTVPLDPLAWLAMSGFGVMAIVVYETAKRFTVRRESR